MKVAVVYTCVTEGSGNLIYATRFVSTHNAFDGGYHHQVVAVCNGGPPSPQLSQLLGGIDGIAFPRSNEGWDIGGYIEAARGPCAEADIIVCLGQSVHFHRHGWLERIVRAWEQFGPGMYGFLSSFLVRPHLQTTAFATSPQFLQDYPVKVVTKADRYEFEHGRFSFMNRLEVRRKPVKLVTFDGVYSKPMWRSPNNILWKGDQSNCLVWCNHTEDYAKATQKTKDFWQKACSAV